MNTRLFTLALGALALAGAVRAAIVVPGANGTDGALNITADTVIDLSKATNAAWDAVSPLPGSGVYDSNKWAVVFKYTEVNIAAGATVTFKNHASRAPVVWLVSGNATVDGTVNLSGQNFQGAPALSEPGPGGFRGGPGIYRNIVGGSAGFGVGGGGTGADFYGPFGLGGSYGSVGSGGPGPYGGQSIIPLVGGSGGGGNGYGTSAGGGAGGGAILVACAKSLTLTGAIVTDGGAGVSNGSDNRPTGGGSGGGIRLITETLDGKGRLEALGGTGGPSPRPGGLGRIRIERAANTASLLVVPDPSLVDLAPGATGLIWPPVGAPEVRVVSIGAINTPADPRAEFGTIGADVALPITASTQVLVETKNVEQASQVKVRGTPRSNGNFTEVVATVDNIVSNDPLVIRWKADLPVNVGYSAVQAHVIRP